MSYELFVERPDEYLEYDAWQRYLAQDPELRPDPESVDNAQMEFDGEWITVFCWSGGSIDFQLGNYEARVLTVALRIAAALGARVRGEGDELYTTVEDLWPESPDDDECDEGI